MDLTSIRTEWVGRVIDGKFSLLQWLGSSDAGGVFLAEVDGLPRKQANVELIPADAENAEALAAAWALAGPLSHPHLIRIIDSGKCQIDTDSLIYAVTEHPEEVLSEILPTRPLTPTEVGDIVTPIVDALTYLHSKGIVHGHLRPATILVVDDRVKLSSRRLCGAGTLLRPMGARQIYDAPETLSEPITPAADIWSLGVTLIEALTQQTVWGQQIDGDPEAPYSIPEPLRTIVQECLHADPARRWTLSDIKARLQPNVPVSPSAVPVVVQEPVAVEKPVAVDVAVAKAVVVEEPVAIAKPAVVAKPVVSEPVRSVPKAETAIAAPIPGRKRGLGILAAAILLVAVATTLVLHFHHGQPAAQSTEQQQVSESAVPTPASPSAAASAPAPTAPAPTSPSPAEAAPTEPAPAATDAPTPTPTEVPNGAAPSAATTGTSAAPTAPAPSAPVPADQSATTGEAAGDVTQQGVPNLLPSALKSIHGDLNVKVKVAVDADGNVESASLDSPGPSKYFARVSLEAAQKWKFKPVQVDGKAVASTWMLRFKFTQAGAQITPVKVSP